MDSNGFLISNVYAFDSEVIIPGLPPCLSTLCLARVPRGYHPSMQCVCKKWRKLIKSPSFFRLRKVLGIRDSWIYAFREHHVGWEVFIPERNNWNKLPSIESQKGLYGCGTVSIDSKLFVIGGSSEICPALDEMWIYDGISNEWTMGPKMPVGLSNVVAVVLQSKIYVIGIVTNLQDENLYALWAFVFDPRKNMWEIILSEDTYDMTELPDFNEMDLLPDISPYAFAYCEVLYVSVNFRLTKMHNPADKSWTNLTTLPFRCPHVEFNDHLFSFESFKIMMKTISANHTFTYKSTLDIPELGIRKNYGLLCYEEKLVIIAGISHPDENHFQDVYAIDIQAWMKFREKVVHLLPNLKFGCGAVEGCTILSL